MSLEYCLFDLSPEVSKKVQERISENVLANYTKITPQQFSKSDYKYLYPPIRTSLREASGFNQQAYTFRSLGAALAYDLVTSQLEADGIFIDFSTPNPTTGQINKGRKATLRCLERKRIEFITNQKYIQNPDWLKDYLQQSSPGLWGFLNSVAAQFVDLDQKEYFWEEALNVILPFYIRIQPPNLNPLIYTPKRVIPGQRALKRSP